MATSRRRKPGAPAAADAGDRFAAMSRATLDALRGGGRSAKAGKAAGLAVREGVQMHGGIGMTDEYDIGLYMKRDRALAEFLGDQYYHANRVAELSGY